MSSDELLSGAAESQDDTDNTDAAKVDEVSNPSADAVQTTATASPDANESAAGAETTTPTGEEPDAPRRRLRLNPTIHADAVKAVPNLPPAPSEPSSETESVSLESPSETPAASPVDQQPQPHESSAATQETTAETASVAAPETTAETKTKPAEPSASTPASPAAEEIPAEDAPAETEAETAPAEAETPAAEVDQVPAAAAPAPVELPPKDEELDALLEAEISAALSEEEKVVGVEEATVDAESADQQLDEESLEPGTKMKGTVQSIHADNVFFDLGCRSPGMVHLRQFGSGKHPAVGQEVEVVVERVDEAEGLIHVNLPRGARRVGGNWNAVSVGQMVDCLVTKTNKGGLEVTVSSLRGFMPAGQVDRGYVADLEPFVGQKLRVQVLEVNPRKRNLVVSRRALIELERKEAEELLWAKLEVGQTYRGTIRTIKAYGAFVDIGGVDGFLHIGEISWSHINHPRDVIHEGQEVEVKVLSLDSEKKRIGLGMRQMMPNPWTTAVEKYGVGTTVTGKVTRTTNFGAFVELDAGIEGLVHISELDYRRVKSVTEVLNVGQEADFQILEVDPDRKRVSLSLKALQQKPEPQEKPTKSNAGPSPGGGDVAARKRKGKLKGGTGSQAKGGLFGNPKDFQ